MRLRISARIAGIFLTAVVGCEVSVAGVGSVDVGAAAGGAPTPNAGALDDATTGGRRPGFPSDPADGAPESAFAPVDAASPDVADAGSVAPEPSTVVPCAAADCTIATHFCCLENNTGTCVAYGGACTGINLKCNDTRDCFGATICCYDHGTRQGECRGGGNCGAGRIRLCDPDSPPGSCPGSTTCGRFDGGGRGAGTCQ